MDKRFYINMLFDIYGPLMTDRRSETVRLCLEEDLSLSEAAEATGVSRQAVHDSLNKAEKQLEEYERLLGVLKMKRAAQEAIRLLDEGDIHGARKALSEITEG
ncbi:MAG: hypothetical protein J5859_06375 [Clostridia bacterium]|nr:hypothetical protein [Clostridia bacterium]